MKIFAALGDITFISATAPITFKRKVKANIAKLDRLNNSDQIQTTSTAPMEFTLTYEYDARVQGSDMAISMPKKMDQYVRDGKELSLIQGDGYRWGVFIAIEHESEPLATIDGIEVHVRGTIKLVEVVK